MPREEGRERMSQELKKKIFKKSKWLRVSNVTQKSREIMT